jgi:hypothetical protein
MLRFAIALALTIFAAGCDGDPAVRLGGGDEVAAWLGTYDAVWDGATTQSSPPGREVVLPHVEGVVMTVLRGADGQIEIRWRAKGHLESGTAAFKVDGNRATLVNLFGDEMRSCDVCTASLDGDTLTQTQQAHVSGVSNGIPWSGTYSGSWVGTRND